MASRFTAKPAVRTGQKARLALSGPSGSGKTFAGLTIAEVLAEGGPVLVIDTERGSSALYSDRFTFEIIEWDPPYDPRELGQEIAARAGDYSVLMVDSLTHFWAGEGGTQSIVDTAAARAKGNSFAGWLVGTPAQDAMVNGLLMAPCHVIATMRSKTEYVLQEKNGKQVPVKMGMAPIQRPGLDFEFSVTCEIDRDHNVVVDKSRCEAIADQVYGPGRASELATALVEWLSTAAPTPLPPKFKPECPTCGETIPGADQDREPMREHMVDAHGWQRNDDGTVVKPKPAVGAAPESDGGSTAPPPAEGGTSDPSAENPPAPASFSDEATPPVDVYADRTIPADPGVKERLIGRIDALPADLAADCVAEMVLVGIDLDALMGWEVQEASGHISDWEERAPKDLEAKALAVAAKARAKS